MHFVLFLLFSILLSPFAEAACTGGVAGQKRFNSGIFEFCDDNDEWKAMFNWPTTSCAAGDAGKQRYNSGDMEFCDGSDWISMKGRQEGPCSEAGNQIYSGSEMMFCDGTNLYKMRYYINPVDFDGTTDYLRKATDLTGATDSKMFTTSFWFRTEAADTLQGIFIDGGTIRFRISYEAANSIRFLIVNPSGTSVLDVTSSTNLKAYTWYHVVASFDLANASNRHLYINDVSDLATITTYTDSVMDMTFSPYSIGARENGTFPLNGQLADFWLDFGTYIDLSVEANRRKFYGANNFPVFLGEDGSIPTGSVPEVFQSGATADWHTNKGSGGGFVENGTLANSATNPEDPPPDAFNFIDQTAVNTSTLYTSNIVRITGIETGTSVDINGSGSPQFRICDNADCSTVDHTWGSASGLIDDGQYLQLRLTSNASGATTNSANIIVGAGGDQWDVTTAAVCDTTKQTFTSNGTATVDDNCTSVTIKAWGAGGGGGAGNNASYMQAGDGGAGGYVQTTFSGLGTDNDLSITVGTRGLRGSAADYGGSGGGRTMIEKNSDSTDLIIVGAGGGGGGQDNSATQGSGDAGAGGNSVGGTASTGAAGCPGATGGTQSAGGTSVGGFSGGSLYGGQAGSSLATTGGSPNGGGGGYGGSSGQPGGGGGGDGYYGGGGGACEGCGGCDEANSGGGGSSWITSSFSPGSTSNLGGGVTRTPPNTGDGDYNGTAGYGGVGGTSSLGAHGNDGYVVVIPSGSGGGTPPTAFAITGASGGSDIWPDNALGDGLIVTANWNDAPDETKYYVTIYENDGTTIKCNTVEKGQDVTSHTFTGCTLTDAATYKIAVLAINDGGSTAASNDQFTFTVATPVCTPYTITENFGVGSGSFTNFVNVTGDDDQWELDNNDTPSTGVGPTGDASGSGYYAFTEASSTSTLDEFHLESGSLSPACQVVVSFKYNKRGDNMGDLYFESQIGGGTWTTEWSHLGADVPKDGTDLWRTVNLNVNSGLADMKFRFRGVMPSSSSQIHHSDMAVDEISLQGLDPATNPIFAFTDQTNVANSTLILSDIIQITGINNGLATSITGDGSPQYRICSDATCTTEILTWTSGASTMNDNEYVQLRLTSAAANSTTHTATMTIGTGTDDWNVATFDDTPVSLSFTDINDAAVSALILSDIIPIMDIDNGVSVSISGDGSPEYRICSDGTCSGAPAFTSVAGTINNNQWLQLRLTSNASFGITHSATIVVGASNDQWDVTTNDNSPNAFSFTDLADLNLSTSTDSNIVQITGIGSNVAISISGGSAQYRVCNDGTCSGAPSFTSTAGTINNNQYVQLRMTTSSNDSTMVSTTLTVGSGNDQWDLTTMNTWVITMGGGVGDQIFNLVETNDAGVALIGYSGNFGAGLDDGFLVKLNANGVEQWTKTIGGTGTEWMTGIDELSDGSLIVSGLTDSYGAGSYDGFLVKFNSSGTELWSKTLGGTGIDAFMRVKTTSDSGFIAAGYTSSYGAGIYDAFLSKFNSSGTEVWTRTLGGTNTESLNGVQETSDGGFIVTGYTLSYGAGGRDFFLSKFNSSGTEVWTRTLGGTSDEQINAVQETSDGGFITAGKTASYGSGGEDGFLVKFNSGGTELWSKTIGGGANDTLEAVYETADGGFITAGTTASYGAGGIDALLVKFDSNGNEQWSKTFGGSQDDVLEVIKEHSTGGFVAAGHTKSYGLGDNDILVIRTDENGNTGCSNMNTQGLNEVNQSLSASSLSITQSSHGLSDSTQSLTQGNQFLSESNACF